MQPLKQERELLPGAPPISEADARRKLRKAVETAWIINQDPLANGSVWSPFREQIKQSGIVGHMLLTAAGQSLPQTIRSGTAFANASRLARFGHIVK